MSILFLKKYEKMFVVILLATKVTHIYAHHSNKGCICSCFKEYSIDFTIYFVENDNEVGFVIGLSCVNGIKNIFLLLRSLPIFSALVLSPSFVTIPNRTGLFSLRNDCVEFKTEVSYMDDASFAI